MYFLICMPNKAVNTSRSAIGLVEVLIAFLIMSALLLPTFMFLNQIVKDSEMLYTEAYAISHARFVMDTFLFQIPWVLIDDNKGGSSSGRWAKIEDPTGKFGLSRPDTENSIRSLLNLYSRLMFGTSSLSFPLQADGLLECPLGFKYRVRVKCVTIDEINLVPSLTMIVPESGTRKEKVFPLKELVLPDQNGRYSIMKKLIVEVMWSNKKGVAPPVDFDPSRGRRDMKHVHLVAFKADLEEHGR